jgi:hypothetical protein
MFGDADPLGQGLLLVPGIEPVVIVGVAADRNNAGLRAPTDSSRRPHGSPHE